MCEVFMQPLSSLTLLTAVFGAKKSSDLKICFEKKFKFQQKESEKRKKEKESEREENR
jgi:hypothetical protein